MATTVLTILGDARGARRALGDVRAEHARATAAMGADDRARARERRRDEAEEVAQARRELRNMQNARQRAARERRAAEERERRARAQVARQEAAARARFDRQEVASRQRAEREKTREANRESSRRERLARQEAAASQRADRERTRAATAEARKREREAAREAAARRREEEGVTRAYQQQVRERARAAQRELNQRAAASQREGTARRRSRVSTAVEAIGATAGAARSFAGEANGMVQSARRTAAMQETALNTVLIQTGANPEETARMRARIMDRIRSDRLDPEVVIPALDLAQSSANALRGNNWAERSASIDSTMADVRFASNIDPGNVGGLVRLGALARGQMSEDERRDLLRASAGIAFQGSVETDEMIRGGLQGLREAWSSATSNISNPAEAGRVRAEIARDFMAQVQSQAASGRTVGVSANRSNTIRTALANDERQDRLGQAYARRVRTMTPEQRAAFEGAFSRDERGRYRMSESVRDNASNAARFFGLMHDNDATAFRNFAGAHGGGGNRQLMLTPDVSAITSYFGTTTNAAGQTVRQYDYVNELKRSTITPEREREIDAIRNAEDSRRLQADENERNRALTENTSAIVRFSNAFESWSARNPLASSAATTFGGAVLGFLGPRILSGVFGGGGAGAGVPGGATPAAPGGPGIGAGLGVTALLASAANAVRTAATGKTFDGREVSTARRVASGVTAFTTFGLGESGQQLGTAIGDRLVAALRGVTLTATVDPHDLEHQATRGSSRRAE